MFPRRHPAVELKGTHVGLGVFTRQAFRRCQIVGDVCGKIITSATYDSPFCMELGPGRALEPIGVFRFLNHSCDPNCELYYYEPDDDRRRQLPDRLWLKSLRSIAIGQELTIDYAWPAECAIRCLCGAANCRGWIVAMEELPLMVGAQRAPSDYAVTASATRSEATRAGCGLIALSGNVVSTTQMVSVAGSAQHSVPVEPL